MFLKTVHSWRFHLARLFGEHPVAIAMGLVSGAVLIVVACIALILWRNALALEKANDRRGQEPATQVMRTPQKTIQSLLPGFDSAQFVTQLNAVANLTSVRLDEMSFTFEESANLPYLRYRVKLTANARYPTVRLFVDRLTQAAANVSLDSIGCNREDVQVPLPKCDLVFSAFYRKGGNA